MSVDLIQHAQRLRGYQSAVLALEPISYWRMGDSTADLIGAYDLTHAGGTVPSIASALARDADTASNFAGTSAHFTLDSGFGVFGASDRTLTGWVRHVSSDSGTFNPFFGYGGVSGTGGAWWVLVNVTAGGATGQAGALRLAISGGYITATTDLRGGPWHHFAVVQSGPLLSTGVKLYVNGTAEPNTALSDQTVNTLANSDPPAIGKQHDDPRTFNGSLDDLAWFDRALSAGEVRSLYEVGKHGGSQFAR